MSWIDNIKDRFKLGRLSAVTVTILPLIVVGLGILGVQSYSWITGNDNAGFNFDIGSLWSTETEDPSIIINTTNSLRKITPAQIVVNKEQKSQIIRTGKVQKIAAKHKVTQKLSLPADTKLSVDIAPLAFENIGSLAPMNLKDNALGLLKMRYLNKLNKNYLVNPELTPERANWFFGVSISPALNYRNIRFNNQYLNGVAVSGNTRYSFGLTESERNLNDQVMPSFSFGVDFGRILNKRFSVRSGLYYSTYGEQLQITQIDHNDPNVEHSSFHEKHPEYQSYKREAGSEPFPYANKYSYVEIPFVLEYMLLQQGNSYFSLESGVAFQRLSNVDALVYDFDTDYYYWFTDKDQMFRQNNVSVSAGLSISQFVGSTLELYIKPSVRYNLFSTYKKDYAVIQNQYASGLALGFRQHF